MSIGECQLQSWDLPKRGKGSEAMASKIGIGEAHFLPFTIMHTRSGLWGEGRLVSPASQLICFFYSEEANLGGAWWVVLAKFFLVGVQLRIASIASHPTPFFSVPVQPVCFDTVTGMKLVVPSLSQ